MSSSNQFNTLKVRNKSRSISLQNFPLSSPTLKPSSASYPDLLPDPKKWTSSHVASYLTYCLSNYPSTIVSDLSKYVEQDSTLTGRKFLRLKEEQLKQMNFNEKWIKLIMIGVKSLRREHLKDKILLNGGDVIDKEPDEMKINEESGEESDQERYPSLTRSSFGKNSSYSSTTTISSDTLSNSDLKYFLIPTSFSNLTSDDKEFIIQEFNKLKEFLKSDIEKGNNNDTDLNELNRIVKKVLSNIETNKENDDNDSKINEVDKKSTNTTSSLFSLILFDWLNNKWTKKVMFKGGFAQGVMIGGVAVWTYMKYSKW